MAPKQRRPAMSQMDAALAAMSPYGFSTTVIRRTVQHLLNVHGGGDQAWVLIQDSAYSLLIHKLLDSSHPTDGLTEDNPGDGPNETPSAGCSNKTLLPCSDTQTSDGTPLINQTNNTVSASSETANELPIKAMDIVSATTEGVAEFLIKADDISSSETGNQLPIKAKDTVPATSEAGAELFMKSDEISTGEGGHQLSIKAVDIPLATSEAGAQLLIKADDISTTVTEVGNQLPIKAVDTPLATGGTGNQVLIKATDTVSADNESDSKPAPSPSTKSSQTVGKLCHKKCRPRHGLISYDNNEEDLIELPPDPLSMVYGSNNSWVFMEDSNDEDSDYALLIDKLHDSFQATDDLTEDNPGDGPNEASYADDTVSASSETGNQPPIKSMDIVSATSEAVAELLIKADDISSGETGNQLPIKAMETISATSEAGAKLFIKADEISTSEAGNQLPIKAVGTPSATSEAYAELLIKADDISTSEAGNQLSIKAVDTPSATRVTGNQVPIKATDTASADNESDCKPAPSPLTKSSRPVGKHCHKKRRPCHGWISYDNDEEDLIELPPAPLSMVLVYMQAK
ncbi:uncharacterized protein LOC130721280 [Lotus japonicus]|uniref:uncharacterized protein LOC130721280 n=1 Tax=Lotus japonicus TaxID=34305 RepID=UPI0025844661|nr:uncharacterized protein LOC130721280 [Lotus japonicus]